MLDIESLRFEKGNFFQLIRQEVEAEREIDRVMPIYRRTLQRIVKTSDVCLKLIETKPQMGNKELDSEIHNYFLETGAANQIGSFVLNSIWATVPKEVDTITVGTKNFKRLINLSEEKTPMEWDIGTVKNYCQNILENLPKRRFFF